MRKINKGAEPQALTHFKRNGRSKNYNDLSHTERSAIREACASEQLYLCAYCCTEISGTSSDTMNEHLQCRDHHPQLGLSFNNIVASCKTSGQCDAAKGNQTIKLSPLMSECEHELRFLLSGRVEGLSPRAIDTIRVLNLGDHERNNKKLVEKRRVLAQATLQTEDLGPSSSIEDDELLQLLIDDLSQPTQGRLQPYAPVMVNILKNWLSTGMP